MTNARVQDALPAALAGFGWTCTATGAGRRAARRRAAGNIDALVTLPAGTSATFTVTGTVPAGTTGALINTRDGDAAGGCDRSGAGQQRRHRHQSGGAAGRPDDQQVEQPEAVRAGGAADLHRRGEQRRAVRT